MSNRRPHGWGRGGMEELREGDGVFNHQHFYVCSRHEKHFFLFVWNMNGELNIVAGHVHPISNWPNKSKQIKSKTNLDFVGRHFERGNRNTLCLGWRWFLWELRTVQPSKFERKRVETFCKVCKMAGQCLLSQSIARSLRFSSFFLLYPESPQLSTFSSIKVSTMSPSNPTIHPHRYIPIRTLHNSLNIEYIGAHVII